MLIVTLIVSARVVYGLFRSFEAAAAGLSGTATLDAFGVPESLAAGAIVIGYYLAYNVGPRWRIAPLAATRFASTLGRLLNTNHVIAPDPNNHTGSVARCSPPTE